jgi:ketosteroid isomerase-like protein
MEELPVGTDADVLAVSAARDAALVANDAAAIALSMSDDWVYVGPTGPIPKADIIGWIATGRLVHHEMRTTEGPRVAAYGDTVIVTARKASAGISDGVSYAADEWISEVYVRTDGRWLCVLSQKCPVESQPSTMPD